MTPMVTLVMAITLAPLLGSAQSLASADAADFIGVWTLTLESPQGTFQQTLTVKDEEGKVVAEISSQMQPDPQKITNVTKDAGNLVLKYSGNFQGNPFDAAITVTPDGEDKAKVTFDVNAGMFTMAGAGTRAKKSAG